MSRTPYENPIDEMGGCDGWFILLIHTMESIENFWFWRFKIAKEAVRRPFIN